MQWLPYFVPNEPYLFLSIYRQAIMNIHLVRLNYEIYKENFNYTKKLLYIIITSTCTWWLRNEDLLTLFLLLLPCFWSIHWIIFKARTKEHESLIWKILRHGGLLSVVHCIIESTCLIKTTLLIWNRIYQRRSGLLIFVWSEKGKLKKWENEL